ncbi:MAG: TRAP transporter permease [Thermoprotei archaeon]
MKYVLDVERKIVEVVAILFVLYILFIISGAAFIVLPKEYVLPVALALVYFLGFLFFPIGSHEKFRNFIVDWFLGILGASVALYAIVPAYRIFTEGLPRLILILPLHEVILGIIAMILLLELVRRTGGIALMSIIILFLIFGFFGDYLPIAWFPKSLNVSYFFSFFYLGNLYYGASEGLFGNLTSLVITVISGFLIFGGIMSATGLGKFIIDTLQSLVGWMSGGPAKVSIWASALFGTITGSPVAEVMVIGSLTIPAMLSVGFEPHIAAAIEAAAGCGGELMPPVMGAGAFIMSEMIDIPYIRIAEAAFIPAILYFVTKFASIHFYAKKKNLRGLERTELPKFKEVIKNGWPLVIPLIILIIAILILPSIMWAAFWSIVASVTIPNIKKSTRIKLDVLHKSIVDTIKSFVSIAVIIIGADIISSIMALTGLANLVTQFMTRIVGENLLLALIIAMIGALLLGMIVPATPAYIFSAVTFSPTLTLLGLNPLVAHMFLFYFAIMGPITPPVALATYAASSIAKSDYWKSGLWGTIFAVVGFVVPFIFVYDQSLLLIGSPVNTLIRFFFVTLGFVVLSGAMFGYLFLPLNFIQRILYAIIATLLLYPDLSYYTNIIGLLIVIIIFLYYIIRRHKLSSDDGNG